MLLINFTVIVVLVMILNIAFGENARLKQSRELEQKVKSLDENTKRRVIAMHAAGVPHEAIAQKIAYVAGKSTAAASRLVQGIKNENDRINQAKKAGRK